MLRIPAVTRRFRLLGLLVLGALAAAAAIAIGQGSSGEGVIGPANKIQPSGRKLDPYGKLTQLGNHPGGGALTKNGRFLWAIDAGRGRNDVKIVEVEPALRCRTGARGRNCRKRLARRTGRVVQTIPMPGASGGIAMSPDGRTAFVSGTPESEHEDQKSPEGTPGKDGDVIHVFKYDPKKGTAKRDGVIELPAPDGTPAPQSFPPTNTKALSWPRDIGVSPDGKTLVVALNLADAAAIVDVAKRDVRYVKTGSYPYGAAVTADGKRGLVSNEASGTVSVIDLDSARKIKDIQVGPKLSHPEGIAVDPNASRAYVAVAHQDVIAVVDTEKLEVERSLSVERPEGIGTEPTQLSVTADGCRLLSANSGEDTVAVFALRNGCDVKRSRNRKATSSQQKADAVLQHEGRKGVDLSKSSDVERAELLGDDAEKAAEEQKAKTPVKRKASRFQLVGRIPTGSYPVFAGATPKRSKIVWIAAKGLGVGPNPNGPNPQDTRNSDDAINSFQYLPSIVTGMAGTAAFPTDRELKKMTPKASRQAIPVNGQQPPPGTPIATGAGKLEHVFYVVRENRTYDQILGDDARGDGDPKLTLFGESITPNAHALAKRFPLLDHVYANSEASIDGHFWASAAAVSDYVVKNWHQNYAGRKRPYDFGVYAVTWPSQRFLFDQAEKQGISYFNFGEAVAGTVGLFPDKDRGPEEQQEIDRKFAKSDLGPPLPGQCFSNDASSGGTNVITGIEVFDSTRPLGALPTTESRMECFRQKFAVQLATNAVPKFTYITLPNDHTAGTRPGSRTPRAMVAENDLALGQLVDTISHSPIWDKSLILVIEDDSQDGADHVDAHRIPAFAISPYAKRGAVIHTRYDFLSFIRTLELVVGMDPLNLFDAVAVPLYDAFDAEPSNAEPYDAITPGIDLLERNQATSANAKLSDSLPLNSPDQVPQRILDRILWQSIHGANSEPPPPGPNASGVDLEQWRKKGLPGHDLGEGGKP
jgi:YVTN family beta-propeller protein